MTAISSTGVVHRIIELNEGKAEFYSGNYSFYVQESERRYQERLKQYEKEQAKIGQLTRGCGADASVGISGQRQAA